MVKGKEQKKRGGGDRERERDGRKWGGMSGKEKKKERQNDTWMSGKTWGKRKKKAG